MIPIFRAPVFMARDGMSKEPATYMAMSFEASGSVTYVHLYTSTGGAKFRKRRVRGDIATWAKNGVMIAPQYVEVLSRGGALYMAVLHWMGGSTADARAMIFKSFDGLEWNRVAHPLEGPSVGNRIYDLVFGAGYICALFSDGKTVISSDGTTFVEGAATGIPNPSALAGSPSHLVVAGRDAGGTVGILKATNAPQTSWTSYDYRFAGTPSQLGVGNVFMAMGPDGKISTAPLANPTTWTARATVNTKSKLLAMYRAGRWFLMGATLDACVTATDTLSFSLAPTAYWGSGPYAAIDEFFVDDDGLVIFYGDGRIARSDTGTTWVQVTNNRLPAKRFLSAAYRGLT